MSWASTPSMPCSWMIRDRQVLTRGSLNEEEFVAAAHELLANTSCALTVLRLDNITGEVAGECTDHHA